MLHGILMIAAALALHVQPPISACPWKTGQILTLTGSVRAGGLDGNVLRRTETGTGRAWERTDLHVVSMGHGYDGHTAWSQDTSGMTHDLSSDFARAVAVSQAWLDGRQGCLTPSESEMVRLPPHDEEGKQFEVWRTIPPAGAPIDLWYDAGTGRLSRAFLQLPETRLIRHFEDWRDIGGGRFVAFTERDEFPEDEDETVYHFTKAKVSARAGTSEFQRPPPPNDSRIADPSGVASVAFEDDHRTRIYVPVFLNGKGPFTFELDNGGHFIVSEETAKAAGLAAEGSFNSTGAGNTISHNGFAHVASLKVGTAEVRNQPVRVRSLSAAANDRGPRPPRAGILGLEFFERFVVGINHRTKTVTLRLLKAPYPQPKGVALPLVFADDAPLVAGSFAGVSGDFMLDTGNAGATIIEDFWAQGHSLTDQLHKGMTFNGVTLSQAIVGIGPFQLEGEAISYYGPAERGSEYTRAVAGVYSEQLLSRFNATYDYDRNQVWLDPLPEAMAVPPNRAGLLVARSKAGDMTIAAVAPDSPAAAVGLAVGDTLISMENRATRDMSRADAMALFQQSGGTALTLRVNSNGTERTLILRLREASANQSH